MSDVLTWVIISAAQAVCICLLLLSTSLWQRCSNDWKALYFHSKSINENLIALLAAQPLRASNGRFASRNKSLAQTQSEVVGLCGVRAAKEGAE